MPGVYKSTDDANLFQIFLHSVDQTRTNMISTSQIDTPTEGVTLRSDNDYRVSFRADQKKNKSDELQVQKYVQALWMCFHSPSGVRGNRHDEENSCMVSDTGREKNLA